MPQTTVLDSKTLSSDNERVWKALADPTRRQLMDIIREAPRTTGELVMEFPHLGRCAVMKHMGILEEAGLLIHRKKGKYRWNHLNALPLQQIYERWVKKYEAQWASGLLSLKEIIENTSHQNPKHNLKTDLTMTNLSTLDIHLDITFNAPIEKVWKALAENINSWWSKDFHTSPNTKEFILEARPGGKMYEDYGDGNGLVWADVIGVNAPHLLEMKGHLTPQFGGPAISFLKLALSEENGVTTMKLSDTVMGVVSESTVKSLESGWKLIFGEAMKTFVES